MIVGVVLQRFANGPLQLGPIVRDEVGQVAELRMTPSRFDRVEFRSISRQPLEVDVLAARGQNLFGGRAMYTPTI